MRLTTKIVRIKVLEMTAEEGKALREAIERAERGETDPPIAEYAIRFATSETLANEAMQRMKERDALNEARFARRHAK